MKVYAVDHLYAFEYVLGSCYIYKDQFLKRIRTTSKLRSINTRMLIIAIYIIPLGLLENANTINN